MLGGFLGDGGGVYPLPTDLLGGFTGVFGGSKPLFPCPFTFNALLYFTKFLALNIANKIVPTKKLIIEATFNKVVKPLSLFSLF